MYLLLLMQATAYEVRRMPESKVDAGSMRGVRH